MNLLPRQPPKPQRVMTSEELMRGDKLVLIEHNGQTYKVRITEQGKPLMTK